MILRTLLFTTLFAALAACQQSPTEFSPGARFYGCNTVEVPGGRVLRCPGADDITIRDGVDGRDGANGTDGLDAIIEVIDPCGDSPGVDEVVLRLADNSLLAWYKDKGLFILTYGKYQTTDGTNCVFTVDTEGNVTW